jgi:hypothetical protein
MEGNQKMVRVLPGGTMRKPIAIQCSGLPGDGGLGDHGGHHVGVHVGRRPAVLEVALAVLLRLATHAHGSATVRHTLHRMTRSLSTCIVYRTRGTYVRVRLVHT